ncbi:MAG: tetratricopeptide repeat protein, partial [Polyangiaceae bacterium]|nr:tetratricopeptide repeat protein [Polyangiaceae bacterium]
PPAAGGGFRRSGAAGEPERRAQGRVTMEGLPPSARAGGGLFSASRPVPAGLDGLDDESEDLPPPPGPDAGAEGGAPAGGSVGAEFVLDGGPQPTAGAPSDFSLQAEPLGLQAPPSGPSPEAPAPAAPLVAIRPRRSGRIRVGIAAVLVLAVGGGLLSLTSLGPYGYFYISDKLNQSDHERTLAEQRAAAQEALDADTAPEAQRAVAAARAAQAAMPRFAPMASYAAYLAFANALRFGPNSENQAYAKQVLEAVGARTPSDEQVLALAALDAMEARLPGARERLAGLVLRLPEDVDVAVLAGEIELSAKQPKEALAAWKRAAELHPSARTVYGRARAELASGDEQAALASARRVLELSAHHAGARALLANLLGRKRDTHDEALALLAQVTDEKGPVRANASPTEIVNAQAVVGEIHLEHGRMSAAEAAFGAALKLDPRAMRALIGLGELLYRAGRYTEAFAKYQSAMSFDPDSVPARIGAAKTLLAQEKAKDAKTLLKKLEDSGVKDALVGYWQGRAEQALGRRKEAEEAYKRAIGWGERDVRAVEAYVALANLMAARGDADGAEKLLAEADGKLPQSAALHLAKGEFALNGGRFDDAKRELTAALELDPTNVASRFKLAVALRRASDFEAAGQNLDAVEKADADYPGLALERGLLFEAMGQRDLAIEAYSAALKKAPDDLDLKLRVGSSQVLAGHPKQAIDLLKKVLESRSQSAEVNYFLGRAWLGLGQNLSQAVKLLQTATELDPNQSEYFLYLGWAANEAGDGDMAGEALKRALELDQGNGDAYWQRAVMLQKKGKAISALTDAKKALQLRPSRYEAFATMALCYQDQSEWSAAKEAWRQAVAGNGRIAEWHYRLGKILSQENDDAGAADELVKAITLATDKEATPGGRPQWLVDANFLAAEALRRTNDKARAITHYQEYLRIAPTTHPYRRDAEEALRGLGVRTEN